MSITRQFFNELRPLFRVLEDPFFQPAFGTAARSQLGRRGFDQWPRNHIARPAVDLTESGNNYIVEAELPGIKKENVEVRVGDNGQSVTIEGKIVTRSPPRAQEQEGQVVQSSSTEGKSLPAPETREVSTERQFVGSTMFSRTVWLPEPVESTKVTAKLEDGVLTVTVPKAEAKQGVHKVEIQ
ncbi:HSP20-like chaperone [Exidia glandulosa HHB12029]|uniref:HSP20-like chaperone n=1 Tax=Exidia glandulosa HHB12029 TaxID=1314781 RepID=A0A165QAT6_EXIGL|nr:HSP20-like chaperone [Exidia glandulosa HHB12029]